MSPDAPSEPLSEALSAFIQSGLSITVASRDGGMQTSLARCFGCRVSADRRRVTLVVQHAQAAAVLADVRTSGHVAAVFSKPSTNQTVQLKGQDAVVEPQRPFDQVCAGQHVEALLADLHSLHEYGEPLLRAVFQWDPADLCSISFTPSAGFIQTPGPSAGNRLP